MITNVPEMIEKRKQKQKYYFDQHMQELPKLDDGDAIRMRLPGEKMVPWTGHWRYRQLFLSGRGEWETVSSEPPKLRATPEKLGPSETSEQTETSSVELPQPLVLSTPVVREPPSRPTCERRTPLWLQDYEC